MEAKKRIICVVGDLGGTHEVQLVAVALQHEEDDIAISWIADPSGRGQDFLKRTKVPFESRGPDFVTDHAASAIVIGTSGSPENTFQGMWTLFGKLCDIPVFWVEDFWGTGEVSAMGRWDPDAMFVIDDMALKIARRSRRDIETLAFGKPSFGKLGELVERKPGIRNVVRSLLEVGAGETLVTFWSSGESVDRVIAHLDALAQGLSGRARVAPRFHPKFPKDSANKLWEKSRQLFDVSLVDARRYAPQENLSIGSDVVVADWGCTEGVRAMLLGIPTAVTLFPADDESVRRGLGYTNGIPPMCLSGAAIQLDHPEQCADAILREALDLRLQNDRMEGRDRWHGDIVQPDAADRIADVIIRMSW